MKRTNRLTQALKVNTLFGVLMALLVVAALLINAIALLLTDRYGLTFDLTANAAYEIGADTQALLQGLSRQVDVYVLSTEDAFGGSNYLNQAKRLIQQYPRYSPSLRLHFVDYTANPSFAAGFPDLTLSSGDLIVRCGEQVKHIPVNNLFHYTYTASGSLAVESSRAEEALTSAILYVTQGKAVQIAVLTGNGVTEAPLFTALLADNNYQLASVNLTTGTLDGYDAALLLAPTADLSEDVLRKLDSFLYNGGRYGKALLYTASAAQGALPHLDAFLAEWGIAFQDGAVFETTAERTYQYQPYYPLALYQEGRYTSLLRDANTPFLMPLARPMQPLFTSKDGYYVETLLAFGDTAGVRPADAGEDFTAENATLTGPLPALALSSYHATSSEGEALSSTLIASASTGIFDSIALQNSSLTNGEYLLALLGDITNQEAGVRIQSKSLAGKTLGATSAQVSTLGVLLAGVLPLSIIALGLVIWLVRRYK